MPMYTYECQDCQRRTDAWRKMDDRGRCPQCDCGGKMARAVERANVNPDIYDGVYDENLVPEQHGGGGVHLKSREHRRQLMKKYNLTEMG